MGRGSAGCDPSHWQGAISPFLSTLGPQQAPSPFFLLLWELQARAAGRNWATDGIGRRHSGQPECSGILQETLPRGKPQEAERSWPPPAWPAWASKDAPDSCPPAVPSRSDERLRLGPAVRVKGLKRTALEFSALCRAQLAHFPNNVPPQTLFQMLPLIVQALRELILICQTLKLISNRPQRADPVHATLKEKKTP